MVQIQETVGETVDDTWMTGRFPPGTTTVGRARVPRPRIRGLRVPALPSWPLLSQVVGGVATLSGVYLQWGSAVTLIAGGAAAVVLGTLRESGRI